MADNVSYKIDITGNYLDQIDKMKKSYAEFNANVSKPIKQPSISTATGSTGENLTSARKQMVEIRNQMIALDQAGQGGSKTFLDLARKAGGIKDSINAANDQMKTFAVGSKLEGSINFMKSGFDAITGSAQVVTGSMALFGVENDNVAKSIQRMMALQSLANGVKTVFNSLTKEGALVTGLMSAKTVAATAIQAIYTTVVGTSTGALKAFKLALAATGIGALVVGVGFLVSKLIELKDAANDSSEELNYLNSIELKDKFANSKKNVEDYKIAVIESQIELLKSEGKIKEASVKQDELNNIKKVNSAKKLNEDLAVIRKKTEVEIDAFYKKNDALVSKSEGIQKTIDGKIYRIPKKFASSIKKIKENGDLTANMRLNEGVLKAQVEANKIKTDINKNNKALKNETGKTLANVAPKTFNVYITELGHIDKVDILNQADEKAFQQTLQNVLMGAINTVQAQAQ